MAPVQKHKKKRLRVSYCAKLAIAFPHSIVQKATCTLKRTITSLNPLKNAMINLEALSYLL